MTLNFSCVSPYHLPFSCIMHNYSLLTSFIFFTGLFAYQAPTSSSYSPIVLASGFAKFSVVLLILVHLYITGYLLQCRELLYSHQTQTYLLICSGSLSAIQRNTLDNPITNQSLCQIHHLYERGYSIVFCLVLGQASLPRNIAARGRRIPCDQVLVTNIHVHLYCSLFIQTHRTSSKI